MFVLDHTSDCAKGPVSEVPGQRAVELARGDLERFALMHRRNGVCEVFVRQFGIDVIPEGVERAHDLR